MVHRNIKSFSRSNLFYNENKNSVTFNLSQVYNNELKNNHHPKHITTEFTVQIIFPISTCCQ